MVAAAFPSIPLVSPFDITATVEGIRTGIPTQIYNYTADTGIAVDLTNGTLSNSTIGGTGSSNLNPIDYILFPVAAIWTFIQFVTGGFIFQMLGLFGLPAMFTFTLQGIIGILFARMVIYFALGR